MAIHSSIMQESGSMHSCKVHGGGCSGASYSLQIYWIIIVLPYYPY